MISSFFYTNPKEIMKVQWSRVQCFLNASGNAGNRNICRLRNPEGSGSVTQISLKNGDIVLLRDPESQRHNWPLVIVENAIPGKDGGRRVRKVQIRASGNGVSKTYRRPVTF